MSKVSKKKNIDDNGNIITGFYVRVWYDADHFDGGEGDGVVSYTSPDEYEFHTKKEADKFCLELHKQMMKEEVYAFEFGEIEDSVCMDSNFIIKRN